MGNRIVSNLSSGDLSLLLVEITPGVFALPVTSISDDNAFEVITYEHARIHEGRMFDISVYFSSVTNNSNVDILIVAGAKDLHIASNISTIGDILVTRFRSPTVSGNGTLVNPVNVNDNWYLTAPVTKHYHTPTVTGTGTAMGDAIYSAGGSGSTRTSNSLRVGTERIYKANTTYLLRIQNISGNTNKIGYEGEFYEE